jgi:hypothetical protein
MIRNRTPTAAESQAEDDDVAELAEALQDGQGDSAGGPAQDLAEERAAIARMLAVADGRAPLWTMFEEVGAAGVPGGAPAGLGGAERTP